jgi:hypothetical protein
MTPNDNRIRETANPPVTLNDYRVRGYLAEDTGKTSMAPVVASVLVAAVLGVGAYLFLGSNKTPENSVSTVSSSAPSSQPVNPPSMAAAPAQQPVSPMASPVAPATTTAAPTVPLEPPAPTAKATPAAEPAKDLRASSSKQAPKKSTAQATDRTSTRTAAKSPPSETSVIDQTATASRPAAVPSEPVATAPSESTPPSSN